jgi:V0 complex accessory subunit Ac45/VOA1 transmembrane domain
MSRLRALGLPICVAASVVTLLLLTFRFASGATFVPHGNGSPPQYNFKTFLPNRVWINGTFIFVGPQFITPNILWGLGVGFFMLIILYIALSCLMSIQRPVRMSSVPLVLSKEY